MQHELFQKILQSDVKYNLSFILADAKYNLPLISISDSFHFLTVLIYNNGFVGISKIAWIESAIWTSFGRLCRTSDSGSHKNLVSFVIFAEYKISSWRKS